MKTVVLGLVVFLLIPSVFGLGVSRLLLDTQVEGMDLVTEFSLIVKGDEGDTSFVLSVPPNSRVIFVKDGLGDVNSQISGSELSLELSPFSDGEQRTIIGEVISESAIAEKGNFNEFLYVFKPSIEGELPLELTLYLPEGAQLVENDSIRPKFSVFNESDNSLWWGEDVVEEEIFLARFVPDTRPRVWVWVLGVVVGISFVVVAVFQAKKIVLRRKRLKGVKILNEKERIVLELVIQQEGITQFELKRKTNLTKSNLSKVLAKLETRALIERKKYGKVNYLYPGEKLKEI